MRKGDVAFINEAFQLGAMIAAKGFELLSAEVQVEERLDVELRHESRVGLTGYSNHLLDKARGFLDTVGDDKLAVSLLRMVAHE